MHNTPALAVIDEITHMLGEACPQVAVFDTAFHTTLAPGTLTYAGPFGWLALNSRRYGFHGISHQYATHRAAKMLSRPEPSLRIVTCHLGSGCSLAAVQGGRSVDTTMGFTPLDGVRMARHSGAIDPGILIHLLRQGTHTPDSLDRLLNYEAGLAGLYGRNRRAPATSPRRDRRNPRVPRRHARYDAQHSGRGRRDRRKLRRAGPGHTRQENWVAAQECFPVASKAVGLAMVEA